MLTHRQASIFLFLEGFASIAIQFLILRQLTPFVGSSVIIVSIVISLFLAALAIGYHSGGNVKKDYTNILSNNLFKAAVLLGLFSSYLFISVLYHYISFLNPVIVLVFYLLFIMVPIVYFVAQTIPILVNSMRAASSGKQAGDALLYSTLGNVFGGIITTVIIMYYLGTSWAIMITTSILFGLSFVISSRKRLFFLKTLMVFPIVFIVNISYTNHKFVAETAYANYEVYTAKADKRFLINKSNSSIIYKEGKKGYKYLESIKNMIKLYAYYIPNPRVLVLGAGGFTLNINNDIPGTLHYVDIDKQIKVIAKKYFLEQNINATFTGEDARIYLRNSTLKYDIIIVDAYTNKHAIPENLTSIEFYALAASKLKSEGLLITNIITNPFLSDDFSKRIDNTIRTAFTGCFTNVADSIGGNSNILYVCSIRPVDKEKETSVIYKDNTNGASIDFFMDRLSR